MNTTLKEPPPSGSFGALLMGKRINSTKSGTKVQDPLRNHHNTNAAFCSKHRTSSVIVSPSKPPRLSPELYNNLVKRFVPPSPLANTPLTGVKLNIKSKHKHQLLWLNPTAQEDEPTRTKSSLCMGVKIGPIVIHSSKNTREVKPTKNNLQVSLKQNDAKEPVALLCVDCLSIKKEPMRVKFQSHEYVPLEVVGEQLKKESAPGVAKSDQRLERVYDVLTPNSPETVAPAPAKTPRLPANKKSEKRIYHQGLSPSGASYAVCSHAPVKVRDKKVPPTLTLFHVHRIQFDPKVTNRRYVDVATLFDAFLTSPIDTLSISEITSSTKPKRKTNKRSKQLSHIIHAKKPLTTPSRHSNTSENPNKDKNKPTENPAAKNPDDLFKFPDGTFYCEKMLEKLVRMKRLAELTAKQRSAATPRKKQGKHYLEELIQKSRAQDSDTHAPNVTLQNVADPSLTKRICAENDNSKEQTSSSKKTTAARKRSSKPVSIINTKSEADEFQFESLSARQIDDSVICQTDGSTLYNTLSYADSSIQHCTETLSTASTTVSPIPSQISTEQKLKPDVKITSGDQTIDSISASDSRFEKPCDVSLSQYELQAESEASCNDTCSQEESMMDDGDSTSRTRHVTSPANHVIRIPHLPLDDYDNDYWSMSNCKENDNHISSLNVTGDYQNHSHDEINTYRTPLHIVTNDYQNPPLNEVNDYRKPSHSEINDHQIPSHNEINDHQNPLRNEINDHQNHLRNEINDHQSLSCNADHKSATPYLASHSLCLSRSSRSLRTQEPTSTIVSSCLVSDLTSPRHQTCLEKNAMSHHLPHICSKTSSSRLISSSNEFSACVNNANTMTGEVMSNQRRHLLVNSSVHSPSGWASTSLHPPSTLVNSSLQTIPGLVSTSLHPPSTLVSTSLHPPSGLVRQGHVKPNKKQIQTSESSKSLPQHQNSTVINGKSLRRFNSVEMKDSMSEKSFDHAKNAGANEAEVMRDAVGSTHDSVERVSSLLDSCDANSVRSQGVRSSVVKCGCGSLSSRRLVDEVSTVLDDGVTADTLTEADVTTDVGGEDVETFAEVDVTVVEGGASMVTLAETDVTFKDGCVAVDTLREAGVPTEDDEASAGLIAEVDVMKERNELSGSTLELDGLAGSQVPELTRSEVPRSRLPGSGLSRSGLPGSGLSRSGLSGSGLDHKQDQQLLTDGPHFKQKSETPIPDIESTQRSATFFVNEQLTDVKQPPLGLCFNKETTLSSDVINEQPIASDDKLRVTSQNPHELSLPPPHPDHHLGHLDPTQPDPTHPNPTQPDPANPNPTHPGTTTSYMSCSQTSQRSGQNVSIYSSRDETCSPDPPDHLKHHHHHRAPTPHDTISTEVSQTNLYDNYSLSQIDLHRKNITFSSDMNNFVSEEFLEYLNSLPSRGISKCNLQIPSVYAKLDRREYPPGPVRRLEPLGCGDGLLERSNSNRTCLVAYHPLLPARVASPGHQSISITGRTVIPDIRGASQTRKRHQDVQYSICGRCRTGGVQHQGIVPQYLASSYSTSPHCTSHYRAL